MEIKDKITEIITVMRSGAVLSPAQIVSYHQWLAGTYAFLSEQFIDLEVEKAGNVQAIRKEQDIKSDAAAERVYLTTDLGKSHLKLKYQLKYIEKLLSSLKLSKEVATTEQHNQY